MAPSQWLRRILRYCLIALFFATILCIAIIHIQQRILRTRAESLLTEFQQIEVTRTTFEGARNFLQRWQEWGEFSSICIREICDLRVALSDPIRTKMLERRRDLGPFMRLAYVGLGGRPSVILAEISVKNGIVVEKRFFVVATLSPELGHIEPGYYLDAAVWSGNKLSGSDSMPRQLTLHPDYMVIVRSSPPCSSIGVRLASSASPEDARRLTQFDFSFLTHLVTRRENDDLMPGACAQARRDRSILGDYPDGPPPPGI